MSNLKMVVSELQQQNRSLIDVREDIKGLLQAQIDADKEEKRSAGDAEEERRESKKQIRLSERSRPKSFGAGLAQGTGLAGLSDGIRGMLGPLLGSFAGALGGMSIGGLLGAGIGYLFRVAAGAVLGERYLKPLIDKMLPDFIQDFELFGDGKDAMTVSELSSMVAGAAALIFGPKLIGRLISKGFGSLGRMIFPALLMAKDADFIGKDEKEGINKKVKGRAGMLGRGLMRNLALAGIIGFIGEELGTAISGLTGSEVLGDSISSSAEWAAMGLMLFGPKAALVLGLAALAYSGAKFIVEYFGDRRQEQLGILKEQIDDDLQDAAEATDVAVKAYKTKMAIARAQGSYSYMDPNTHLDPEQRSKLQKEMNLVRNEDPEAFRLLEAQAAPLLVNRNLGADPKPIWDAAFTSALTKLSVTRPEMMAFLAKNPENLKGFLANSPFLDGYKSMDGFYQALDAFVVGGAADKIIKLAPKPIAPQTKGNPYVTEIKTPGGTYTPGIQWEKIKSVPGFGVADMFGSGNIFNNGPQPQSSAPPVNIGDYSTKVSNFSSKNTFLGKQAPPSIDALKAYLGED